MSISMSITWGVFQIITVFPCFSLGFFEPFPWDLGNPRCVNETPSAPSRRTTHRETPRTAILAVSWGGFSMEVIRPNDDPKFGKVAEEFPKKNIHDIISNLIMKICMMTKVRNIWQVFNLKNIFRELGGNIFKLEKLFSFLDFRPESFSVAKSSIPQAANLPRTCSCLWFESPPKSMNSSNESKGLQFCVLWNYKKKLVSCRGRLLFNETQKHILGCGAGMWWMFWNNVYLSTWSLGPVDSDMNPKKTTHCRNVDRC